METCRNYKLTNHFFKGEKKLKKIKNYLCVIGSLITVVMTLQATELEVDLPMDVDAIEITLPETKKLEDTTNENAKVMVKKSEEELKDEFLGVLESILARRNAALLAQDNEKLHGLYNTSIKTGLYAFESESIKMKYLKNWAEKQHAEFTNIESIIHMRKVRDRESGLFGMTCNVSTAFTYNYKNTPDVSTTFKLGTSHYIHLQKQGDGSYLIVKEWYTDPFADSLDLENIKSDEVKDYISKHEAPNYTPDDRTKKAIEYAHAYSGIGEGEHLFKYNKNYLNCNPRGGDCANFASQILYEGGKFKKTDTWNYTNDGTKAWVNAQAFKNYMVHSGRASYIARGSYKEVYKDAYQLRPGDFVAYEKKGRITHISTVTGLDNKGYPLVTCHNTDRLLVPYDLGWSNKNITFHLIDVHY